MIKRKKISTKIKTRILEESYNAGSIIAEIARKHGISTELLYSWRTKYKKNNNRASELRVKEIIAVSNNNNKFVEVVVSDLLVELDDNSNKSMLRKVLLEYEGATVIVEGEKSKRVLPEIIKIMEMAI